ncbi:MAG: aldehyde:ferredoxin oxidoreductase, partial [Lachnospiraceae bacterium]|nr:aldehyde:ferredoxin oxidoreductase [Lachnospiraceae bacterium]
PCSASILLTHPNAFYSKAVNKVLPFTGAAMRVMNKFPEIASINLPLMPNTKGLELVTGMKMSVAKYAKCGERGYNLERALDVKFGVSAKDDTLPKRLTDELQDPSDPKSRVPLERMKKVYYNARGWTKDGTPSSRTLKKLKIEEKK